MRIALRDHLGKGRPYAGALLRAGHELVSEDADLLLIDLDDAECGYVEVIEPFKDAGATVLLYPHGASPLIGYDGITEPSALVDASLQIAPGHAEVMRRLEYPTATHVVGWPYSEIGPFRSSAKLERVLLAPTHPSGHGYLPDLERELNAHAYAQLLDGPWELTVRYFGTLEQNGLWDAPGVRFVRSNLGVATDDIERSDAVVAGVGTFPWLSIARGVPTVQYGQDIMPTKGHPGDKRIGLRHFERYHRYMRYPFDTADGPLDELLYAAARSEEPILEWKRRFIGEPFDERAYVELVERIVGGALRAPFLEPTRRFTVTAFVDELRERPELLATYARCFSPDDDATLVLWSPGHSADMLLETAEAAVVAAGLDADRLPDVLLAPLPGGYETDAVLAARSSAVLSEWPGAGRLGELPRFGAADGEALAAAAGAALGV
jgi:hypothetical protein